MEQFQRLTSASYATEIVRSEQARAAEFVKGLSVKKVGKLPPPVLVSESRMARGPKAPVVAPKSHYDKFLFKYHHKYIKPGSAIPLIHMALLISGAGILVHWKSSLDHGGHH